MDKHRATEDSQPKGEREREREARKKKKKKKKKKKIKICNIEGPSSMHVNLTLQNM